jgi:tetratricopeptide (TPR) repeat protein
VTRPATASTGGPAEPPATPAESCESAAALNDAGDREGAHAAYLKVLTAKPSSECALAGAKQTAASTSVWTWLGDAAVSAGKALAAVVLGALLLTIIVLLWLQLQTRLPGLRDRVPARGIRRPTLQVGTVEDEALGDRLGSATAGLIRGRISWRKDRFGVNLVSGQAGVATALRDIGDISSEAKAAVAVINFLTALLPRRRFVLTGELQPAGTEGAGISLELSQREGYEALITFWAVPLGLGSAASADVYQHLVIAAAAWADHRMAAAVGGDDLLTGDPQSWSFFRCGVDAQRRGMEPRARMLYEQARVMDGDNVGALANLGIICRRRNEYEDAERYLQQALEATENVNVLPKLPGELNPDWYRIKYQLAALYTNWASDTEPEAQKRQRAETAASLATDLATHVLQAIQQPPSSGGIKATVPAKYVEKTLTPFLEGTIEPSLLVLVACTAIGAESDAPRTSFEERPKSDEVLSSLKSASLDPWQLIAYVEKGANHPPNAFFDLACFYTRVRDFDAASDRLMTAARDTPASERKALIEVAKNDPTLETLRARRPGLIPKLQELFDPDVELGTEDKYRAEEFDLEGHIHAWLAGEGWEISWEDLKSHFTMIASNGQESLLIELASANGSIDEQSVTVTIDKLTSRREDHTDGTIRALLVVPRDVRVTGVDFERVGAAGVEVRQAGRRGGFTTLK